MTQFLQRENRQLLVNMMCLKFADKIFTAFLGNFSGEIFHRVNAQNP